MAMLLSIAKKKLLSCSCEIINYQPMITHEADFLSVAEAISGLMFCRGCVSVLEVEINKGDQS